MMKYIFHRGYLYNNRMDVRCRIIIDGKGKYFYEIGDKNGTIETIPSICGVNIYYENEIKYARLIVS